MIRMALSEIRAIAPAPVGVAVCSLSVFVFCLCPQLADLEPLREVGAAVRRWLILMGVTLSRQHFRKNLREFEEQPQRN